MADLRCHSYCGTQDGCQKALCEWQYLRPLLSFMLMSLNESHYVLLWEWEILIWIRITDLKHKNFLGKDLWAFCTIGCADALVMCWCEVFLHFKEDIICQRFGAVVCVEPWWCRFESGCVIFLTQFMLLVFLLFCPSRRQCIIQLLNKLTN